MQGQKIHVEIMLEKNALRTVIETVAREYCIPCTTGRAFPHCHHAMTWRGGSSSPARRGWCC